MMRLIKTCDQHYPEKLIWVVEGRIVGEYAQLLRQEYKALPPEERSRLRVILEQVSFVDEEGTEVLFEMQKHRVVLEAGRAFVQEVLKKQRNPAEP